MAVKFRVGLYFFLPEVLADALPAVPEDLSEDFLVDSDPLEVSAELLFSFGFEDLASYPSEYQPPPRRWKLLDEINRETLLRHSGQRLRGSSFMD